MKYGTRGKCNERIGEKLFVCERVGRKVGIGKIKNIETWKYGKLEKCEIGKY